MRGGGERESVAKPGHGKACCAGEEKSKFLPHVRDLSNTQSQV